MSVTNASEDSPLPYFRGKAVLEQAVRESGLTYAIVRPTLVFGPEDILVNNIAWILRRFPLFLVPGRGDYLVQPVSVGDTARLCVEAGDGAELDAAGPETYRFDELVALLAAAVGVRRRLVHVSPRLAYRVGTFVGRMLGDVVLTPEEIEGLMLGLLTSREAPTGRESFRAWVERHGDGLGRRYVSELARNYRHAPL